jgi:hypothetical protein
LGGDEPVVVVLGGYQYLHGGHDENIDSALAAVWELSLPADTCIYEAKSPIYGHIEKPSWVLYEV